MTTTSAVLEAAARRLADQGVASYDEQGAYPADATGITLKSVPTAPDRVLTLGVYDIDDSPDPSSSLRTYMLQVRTRGLAFPPTDVDDLAEAARDALTVHHDTWPGDLRVDRCHRVSTIPLGADGNRRQERTDNYRLLTRR